MPRSIAFFILLLLAGCASVGTRDYKPHKSREKKAHARADRSVTMQDVLTNFQALVETEVAWAGIISDLQFNETERTIQVAFDVDYRDFDWKDYGGRRPYRLSAESGGRFRTGWSVDKPARISFLKTLAKPGYMIVVYGKPWQRDGDTVQLVATSVRPISDGDFELVPAREDLQPLKEESAGDPDGDSAEDPSVEKETGEQDP